MPPEKGAGAGVTSYPSAVAVTTLACEYPSHLIYGVLDEGDSAQAAPVTTNGAIPFHPANSVAVTRMVPEITRPFTLVHPTLRLPRRRGSRCLEIIGISPAIIYRCHKTPRFNSPEEREESTSAAHGERAVSTLKTVVAEGAAAAAAALEAAGHNAAVVSSPTGNCEPAVCLTVRTKNSPTCGTTFNFRPRKKSRPRQRTCFGVPMYYCNSLCVTCAPSASSPFPRITLMRKRRWIAPHAWS